MKKPKTKKRKTQRKFWLVESYYNGFSIYPLAYYSKKEAKEDAKLRLTCNYDRVEIIEVREVVKRRKR